MLKSLCSMLCVVGLLGLSGGLAQGEDLQLQLRSQVETKPGSGRYHSVVHPEAWKPAETALVVCDVWDLHHCLNAVKRLEEFAPRLNDVVAKARQQGVTIIHAPSSCMPAYAEHPARLRATATPIATNLPEDITTWCKKIPAEERGVYPIDQTDGGEDDDLQEHAAWAAKLKSMGCDPKSPWKKQSDLIAIDAGRDYISDKGDEIWSVLEQKGIKNVILVGVHTNMCVLGRPFGLRRMVQAGKHAVLMRDMTDTMYNPAMPPYVSHFTGNDLIVSHIEQFVCPTITSDQFVGGKTYRFKDDKRPHVAIVMAEDEYETERTLPVFASQHLGKLFRVSYVYGNEKDRNDIPGLEVLNDANVALISVRRRVLKPEQMEIIRKFVAAKKPVVGIRTASHAFSLRNQSPPAGYVAWPEFDGQVLGGSYTNHHKNELKSTVRIVKGAESNPILMGFPHEPYVQGGSLYMTAPLAKGTTELLTGSVEGQPAEPVTWTFDRVDGGRTFYTSLGHKADFESPVFTGLLLNGIRWAAK